MGSVDGGIRVLLALTAIFVAVAFVKENVIFFIVGLILAIVFLGSGRGRRRRDGGVTYAGATTTTGTAVTAGSMAAEGIRRALPGAGEDG